jgi:hypothetical protein
MIVRERESEFVMIEQDNHAAVSGELIKGLKAHCCDEDPLWDAVEYAIRNHDYGWKLLDQSPFWNDKKQMPFTFTDFPNPPKTVFYKHGIDAVEKSEPYAALLCSHHYSQFLLHDSSPAAKEFIQMEEKRCIRLMKTIAAFDHQRFLFHYGLLQLCDNLSLYICLNEPGTAKEDEHPFYKDGIPLAEALHLFPKSKLDIGWTDTETVVFSKCLFNTPLTVTLKQKVIARKDIRNNGLQESYQNAPYEQINIQFTQE